MNEQQRQQICNETIKRFGRQEWFRDVTVYNQHPNTGEPTLEIKVNYIPIFERKSVLDWAMSLNLSERFIVVDSAGRPQD